MPKRWKQILLASLLWMGLPAHAGTLLVVGDSISAGFGLETGQGWVKLLENRLQEQGLPCSVVNASISGDTSAGGLSRLPGLLERHQPSLLILELGGNDGLRGLPLEKLKQNLAAMIEQARQIGAQVVLLGMRVPPNLGPRYTEGFAAVYRQLAQEQQISWVPFLLEAVWDKPDWMQKDGIHPSALGQSQLLDNVWPVLKPLLFNKVEGITLNSCQLQGL